MAEERRIPTPVGGIPLDIDRAPSVVFAVAYGLLIPFLVWRFVSPRNRFFLQIGSMIFIIERVVVYGLRASQAFTESKRSSGGLLIYLQLSFAQGWLTIAQDGTILLRCLIVNASNPPQAVDPIHSPQPTPDPNREQWPKTRFFVRQFEGLFNLLFLASTVPNIVQGSRYKTALTDQGVADLVMRLRYVGNGVGVLLTLVLIFGTVLTWRKMQDVQRVATLRLFVALNLLLIPGIYRLAVMYSTIPSLTFTGAGSLESTGAKAAFYILHCLPEWVACVLLIVLNPRPLFQTGPWGDWRAFDGQKNFFKERRRKKEEKEREKAELELAQREASLANQAARP